MLKNFNSHFQPEVLLDEINLIIDIFRNRSLNDNLYYSYGDMENNFDKLQFISKNLDYQFSPEEKELSKQVGFLISQNKSPYHVVDFILAEIKKEEFLKKANDLWASYALKAFYLYKIELPTLTFEEQREGRYVPKTGVNSNLINLNKIISLITNVDIHFFEHFLELKLNDDVSPELIYKTPTKKDYFSIHNHLLLKDLRESIETLFSKGEFEVDFLHDVEDFLAPAIASFSKGKVVHNILHYYCKETSRFNEENFNSNLDYTEEGDAFVDLHLIKELLEKEIFQSINKLEEKLQEILIFFNSYEKEVRDILGERLHEISFVNKIREQREKLKR